MTYNENKSRKNRGMKFEDEILLAGEIYRVMRLGYLEKNEVPVGRGRDGKIFYKKKKGFDFFGGKVLHVGNQLLQQAVYIEAKSIRGRLVLLGPDKDGDGLKFHQLQALVEQRRLGAETWVIWKNEHGIFRLDPMSLDSVYSPGKSISADQVRYLDNPSVRPVRTIGGVLDVLEMLGGGD